MVLSSTLQAVRAVMSSDAQPIGTIAENVNLTRGAVKCSLDVLIEMGIVERVNGVLPSEKKGGWIRATYRLLSERKQSL
jgi:predicted transcriptional regulator